MHDLKMTQSFIIVILRMKINIISDHNSTVILNIRGHWLVIHSAVSMFGNHSCQLQCSRSVTNAQ